MKVRYKILILILVSLILVMAALSIGVRIITPGAMVDIFLGKAGTIDYAILVKLRLPRVLLALVIGSSLAVSGTVFQSVLKNPLADPYIIGVSGGAALGATAGIILNAGPYTVAFAAFAGSIAVITAVYLLSKRMMLGSSALILSGLALGFILHAAVLLIYALSRSDQIHRALLWLMGDLSGARYDLLNGLGGVSLLLILAVMIFHKHLDIISMGHRFSRNLGVTEGNIRLLFWIASLLAAISVSLAGVIGFVGLIVPHLMRNIFGPGHLRLVPAAAVGGALFLLASDTIGRSLAPPFEIPVGIITGFIGGAFFLVHMMRREDKP
jgi:iron complex transport system permease protein